jgi:nitroreductase
MLFQAQAAIVVCGDMEKAGNLKEQAYWVQDCSAATQNILLAAESIGLGAVWTAAFPYDDRTKVVIETLNLPGHHVPLNVIPIGYPTGEDKPKDKWKPENVFWQ